MDSSMRSAEWSSDKILHFLELYFMEPSIWNPNDIRHKDRNEVFDAWKRVEEALGFQYTITELKKKRENLMSTYRKLNNKVRTSRILGDVFKPDWFAYETMARYLNDLYENRSIKHEGEDPTSEFEESAQSEEDVRDLEVPVNPEHVIVNSQEQPIASSSKKRKKRKACDENGSEDYEQPAKRAVEEPAGPDECALFCELLGVKLKALNETLRETAFYEINSLMYQLKMQQTGGHHSICSSPCTSHLPSHALRPCQQRFCSFTCNGSPQYSKNHTNNSKQ